MEIMKIGAISAVNEINTVKKLESAAGQSDAANPVCDGKEKELAKDFEAVFLNKILQQMSKTVTNWDGDADPSRSQIRGMFDMFLSQQLAKDGGVGMWKDIYNFTKDNKPAETLSNFDTKI